VIVDELAVDLAASYQVKQHFLDDHGRRVEDTSPRSVASFRRLVDVPQFP
jgi:hypothetical protein